MDFEEMKYWVKYDLFRIDKVETYRYHFKNRSGSVFKQKNAGKVYLLTPYTEYELIKEVNEIEDRLKVTCYLHFHSSIVLITSSGDDLSVLTTKYTLKKIARGFN